MSEVSYWIREEDDGGFSFLKRTLDENQEDVEIEILFIAKNIY